MKNKSIYNNIIYPHIKWSGLTNNRPGRCENMQTLNPKPNKKDKPMEKQNYLSAQVFKAEAFNKKKDHTKNKEQ